MARLIDDPEMRAVLVDGLNWRNWSVKITDDAGCSVLNVLFPQTPYFQAGSQSHRANRGTIS